MPAWVRYLVVAVVLGVAGYLIDAYVSVQPLSHIVAILCYVGAGIAVLLAIISLLRSPTL